MHTHTHTFTHSLAGNLHHCLLEWHWFLDFGPWKTKSRWGGLEMCAQDRCHDRSFLEFYHSPFPSFSLPSLSLTFLMKMCSEYPSLPVCIFPQVGILQGHRRPLSFSLFWLSCNDASSLCPLLLSAMDQCHLSLLSWFSERLNISMHFAQQTYFLISFNYQRFSQSK